MLQSPVRTAQSQSGRMGWAPVVTKTAYVTNIDGSGDYSISKARFVEFVEGGKGDFANFSFHEFFKIFELLERIIKDSETDNIFLEAKNEISVC